MLGTAGFIRYWYMDQRTCGRRGYEMERPPFTDDGPFGHVEGTAVAKSWQPPRAQGLNPTAIE